MRTFTDGFTLYDWLPDESHRGSRLRSRPSAQATRHSSHTRHPVRALPAMGYGTYGRLVVISHRVGMQFVAGTPKKPGRATERRTL